MPALPAPIGWIVVASALIDASAFLAVLLGPREIPYAGSGLRRITAFAALRAFFVTGLIFAAKLVVLVPAGLNPFGVIHLLYVDMVVVVPVLAAGLLLAQAARRCRLAGPVAWGAVLGLFLIPVGVYASRIEPYRLRTERSQLELSSEREGERPLRIAVLSDLQTNGVTAYERMAVDRLLSLEPDVILIPGDVFQGSEDQFEAELPALRQLLGRLEAPGGIFMVGGDVDRPYERLQRLAEGTRIQFLHNAVARTTVGDRRLAIAGLELGFFSRDARAAWAQLESYADPGEIRIVLSHRPDVALELPERTRIDLVVAGHTHGGQVVVPGFGPPMTLSQVPRSVAAGGLHRLGGASIYVSRGVGCERGQAPVLRFMCPPEISLIELRGQTAGADESG